jgi:hypothetical protein
MTYISSDDHYLGKTTETYTLKNSLTFNIWSQYFEAGIEVASREAVTIVRRDKPKCANPKSTDCGQ